MRSISRKFCIRLFMLCKISTAILQIFWQRDGKKQTPHFAPTANARCTIFPTQTLHGDKARPDHQKGANHFLIQRIVFPTGCREKFDLID